MKKFEMFVTSVLIFFFISGNGCNENNPMVKTPSGVVRGTIKTSFNGRKFAAFEGIPYAKPPTGERRFEEPEAIEPWNEVWNANFTTTCAQPFVVDPSESIGEEDCLHIYLYVPREAPNPEEKLDVLVFIHGGAYMYGNAHLFTAPNLLMDRDIVAVSFNYRLGILGFLSTEDDVVPGNNGLKDQVVALEWIKENIASFGGNPDSITLTGLSAGGSSVHMHFFSDRSKGLFHRGLSQSGVALNSWSIAEEPLEKAKFLARALDCPTDSTKNLVNCLKMKPHQEILGKMPLFFHYIFFPVNPFAPVVEKGGSGPFLKDYPYNLLIRGQVQDLPWFTSNTVHEGMIAVEFLYDLDYVNENWGELAPFMLEFNYTLSPSLWEDASQKIKEYYFGNEAISEESSMKLVKLCSDRYFLSDAESAVRLQANVTQSSVFYLSFGYPGDDNDVVNHGAELKYMHGFPSDPETSNDIKMKDLYLDMLISFAKTSKPIFGGVEWEPVSYDKLTYLNITGTESAGIKVETTGELSDRNFWKSLQFLENENLVSND